MFYAAGSVHQWICFFFFFPAVLQITPFYTSYVTGLKLKPFVLLLFVKAQKNLQCYRERVMNETTLNILLRYSQRNTTKNTHRCDQTHFNSHDHLSAPKADLEKTRSRAASVLLTHSQIYAPTCRLSSNYCQLVQARPHCELWVNSGKN